MPNRGRINAPGNYQPGWYPGGVDFGAGVVSLSPGIYVFGPPGLQIRDTGTVRGARVMVFLDAGASLKMSGTSPGLDLEAPPADVYLGIAIFQHRGTALPCLVSGEGTFRVRGTVYLANARLDMAGAVDREIGRVVAESMVLKGSSVYTVTGIGHPRRARTSFLK